MLNILQDKSLSFWCRWMLGLLMLTSFPPAWAQITPFGCDAVFYQTRITGANAGTRLLRYPQIVAAPNPAGQPINYYFPTPGNADTTIPGIPTALLNGLGFNPRDNFLYAISISTTTVGNMTLYRLGANGGEVVGNIPVPPSFATSTAGAFDKLGNYYFAGQAGAAGGYSGTMAPLSIFRIDTIPASGTGLTLPISQTYNYVSGTNYTTGQNVPNVGDFAFTFASDGVNGVLYGATKQSPTPGSGVFPTDGSDTLIRFNLNAGNSTASIDILPITGADVSLTGSAFYEPGSGKFYMYSNSNNAFYDISGLTTLTPSAVAINPPTNGLLTAATGTSDGTSCIFGAPTGPNSQNADISVTKVVSPTTLVTIGQTVTFTVAAFNLGPSPAQTVTINELLPAGLAFQSASTTTGTYFVGTSNWVIPFFPAGTRQTLTLVATVNSFTSATISFVNTVRVVGSNQVGTSTVVALPDPTPTNNTATVSLTASRAANLNITKTNNVNTPTALVAGQTTSYTITVALVSDTSSIDIVNAILTDPVVAGLRCVIGTPACTVTAAPAGSTCPTAGAGVGQLNIGNLQGAGVLIPLLKPGNQMSFKVDCGVTATGQ